MIMDLWKKCFLRVGYERIKLTLAEVGFLEMHSQVIIRKIKVLELKAL